MEINKTQEFNCSIERYFEYPIYKRTERLTSELVISLQLLALVYLITDIHHISLVPLIIALLLSYVSADFINGLVHMYMDNNTKYNAPLIGPFIAAFHLHHIKFFYTVRHPLRVYFEESGTKFWLVLYLIGLVVMQSLLTLNIYLNVGLVFFAIFSSIAEMSHYWCHNATDENTIIRWFQNKYILLNKDYHKIHHCLDNRQYAFLNGITDPIINRIAKRYCHGYKGYADKHTRDYMRRMK